MNISKWIYLLVACLLPTLALAQASPTDAAKRLFEEFVALGRAYDPAVADLYADDAVIMNRRTYQTGEVRDITVPAPKYKALLREVMPIAKAQGDRNTYSDVTFTPQGRRVRITATRFSELKQYASPISLLVGPGPGGKWVIHEELSESRA